MKTFDELLSEYERLPQQFNLLKRLGDVSTRSVVNLGAGHCSSPISQQFRLLRCRTLCNIEVWEPYFRELEELSFMSPRVNVRMDILTWLRHQHNKSWEVLVMLDVLEHFDRKTGEEVLFQMKRVAIDTAILFLPIGEFPQGHIDGNPFQEHLSAWEAEDFVGADIELYPGFHTHIDPPAAAAWVVYHV